VRDAHLQRIDYLLITHAEDHNGARACRQVPIGAFIDYGEPVETTPTLSRRCGL
jgi:hypothetical protein